MDRMREMLLRETNYRCGSCMRNITPRRYQFSEGQDEECKFLNVFDRAHLIPNRIANDKYEYFYNLIALCKQCHGEIDRGALDIKNLQTLKLHWLVASGRFTRLEIDVLMALYKTKCEAPNPFNNGGRWIILRVLDKQYDKTLDRTNITLQAQLQIQNNLYFLLQNIIKAGLIEEYTEQKENKKDFFRLVSFFLTNPNGVKFCEQFHEAYQDLDKIDI